MVYCVVTQVLEDVTGEEFVLLMRVLSGMRSLQTVSGRQQLVELVVEQAFLEQALNPADADSVDRLLQCTRQALPLFSVSYTITAFFLLFYLLKMELIDQKYCITVLFNAYFSLYSYRKMCIPLDL